MKLLLILHLLSEAKQNNCSYPLKDTNPRVTSIQSKNDKIVTHSSHKT